MTDIMDDPHAENVEEKGSEPLLPAPEEKLLPAGKQTFVRQHWYGLLWGVLAVLVIVTYVGIYMLHSSTAFFRTLADFVPTPYGTVGNHILLVGTFDHDVTALTFFYTAQSETQHIPLPTADDIKKIARDNMVRRAEANILASQYNIHVSSKDVNDQYQQIVTAAGAEANVVSKVKTLWGWNIDDYKRNVIEPYVLEMKLAAVLKQDPVIGREIASTTDIQSLDAYLNKLSVSDTHYWFDVTK